MRIPMREERMSVREIVTVGDPVLRERAREVDADELRSAAVQGLIDDLIETMRAADGAGPGGEPGRRAAARSRWSRSSRQPALPVQAADPADGDRQPGDRAGRRRRRSTINEGCLSVPGPARRRSTRFEAVRVRYLDRDGDEHDEVRRGLTAGTFQHEVDHLDGVALPRPRARPAHVHDLGGVRPHHRAAFERAGARDRRAASARDARLWCELAWLGGEAAEAGVLIEIDGRPHRRGARRARAAGRTPSASPA